MRPATEAARSISRHLSADLLASVVVRAFRGVGHSVSGRQSDCLARLESLAVELGRAEGSVLVASQVCDARIVAAEATCRADRAEEDFSRYYQQSEISPSVILILALSLFVAAAVGAYVGYQLGRRRRHGAPVWEDSLGRVPRRGVVA